MSVFLYLFHFFFQLARASHTDTAERLAPGGGGVFCNDINGEICFCQPQSATKSVMRSAGESSSFCQTTGRWVIEGAVEPHYKPERSAGRGGKKGRLSRYLTKRNSQTQ